MGSQLLGGWRGGALPELLKFSKEEKTEH